MASNSDRVAVYTGSFDPITLGHLNVIQRSSRLFDRLIVGIGVNPDKQALFSPAERADLVRSVTADLPNIEIRQFFGLAVSFVHQCEAQVMIRGIRPLTDIAAEFTMLLANRELDPDVETVFLMADQSLVHVSSSLIKQIAPLADDKMLSRFVPRQVIPLLRQRLSDPSVVLKDEHRDH
jgi:pantetheine-phosphate adenylyltransferase